MPDPKLTQQRVVESQKRAEDRAMKSVEIRRVEALELIADTLIDIHDVVAELRMNTYLISQRMK